MPDNIQHLLVLEFDQPDGLIFKALRASLLDAGIDENIFAPVRPLKPRSSGEEGRSRVQPDPPKPDDPFQEVKPGRSYTLGFIGAGARITHGEAFQWFTTTVPLALDQLAEPALGIAALKVTRDILIEWIKAKAGRRVTLTIAGKKVEVRGSGDIDQCIRVLEKLSPSGSQKPRAIRSTKTASDARKKTSKAAAPVRNS